MRANGKRRCKREVTRRGVCSTLHAEVLRILQRCSERRERRGGYAARRGRREVLGAELECARTRRRPSRLLLSHAEHLSSDLRRECMVLLHSHEVPERRELVGAQLVLVAL